MEAYTQINYEQQNTQQHQSVDGHESAENTKLDCSTLDTKFRREFISAVNKGALSRCENLLEALEEGECKKWLCERLKQMDFETIRSSIVSA